MQVQVTDGQTRSILLLHGVSWMKVIACLVICDNLHTSNLYNCKSLLLGLTDHGQERLLHKMS